MNIAKITIAAAILGAALVATIPACSDDETGPGGVTGGGGAGASSGIGGSDGGGIGFDGGTGASGAGVVADGGLDGDVCAASVYTADPVPAAMLFLVDRTGSMNCNAPPIQTSANCEVNPQKVDQNEPSKWEITRDALTAAFQGLESSTPLPSIGVAYFNSDNYCGFPTAPDVDILALSGDAQTDQQLADLLTSLTAVTPQGSTPIIGTMMGAYNYLHQNADSFEGNRFVVLLTDGAETCDPDSMSFLVQKAQEAQWTGVRSFVLGAPGSEGARAFLSQIAFNGGTPSAPNCDHSGSPADAGDCHMDMTLPNMDFATELAANLQAISAEALSCIFDVPQPDPGDPPVDPTKVNVVYTPPNGPEEYFPQDYSTSCDDPNNQGWQYIDNNTKIQLCGAACDAVKNNPGATISIELGCQTVEIPT